MEEFDFSVTVVPSKSGASTLGMKGKRHKQDEQDSNILRMNRSLNSSSWILRKSSEVDPWIHTFLRSCSQEPNAKQFYHALAGGVETARAVTVVHFFNTVYFVAGWGGAGHFDAQWIGS